MRRNVLFLLPLLFLLLASCATRPTVVRENPERRVEAEAVTLTADTVVIDARPAFEYSVAHIPKSVSLQWSDFTEPEPAQRGILQRDLDALARRLARLGIEPRTPVVVVGRGHQGDGEEGRIAWMLAYLGVQNARFAAIDAFKGHLTQLPTEPIKSVPIWKPQLLESLNVTRSELQQVINRGGVHQPIAIRKGEAPDIYRIIDVRSEREYLGKEGIGRVRAIPNMEAINIPWRDFFDEAMRPRPGIARQLQAIGVLPEHRIIVLDENGVPSAAVTMALRALGFAKAGNYAGGLRDLLSAYPF